MLDETPSPRKHRRFRELSHRSSYLNRKLWIYIWWLRPPRTTPPPHVRAPTTLPIAPPIWGRDQGSSLYMGVGMGLCKKWMMGRWLTMAALPRIRVIQRHPSLHRSACTEGGSAKRGTRRPRNSSASGGKPTTVVARTRRGSEAARRAHRRRGQLSSQSTRRSSWLLRRAREWLPMYGCH